MTYPRLSAAFASEASKAVIMRRGPSKMMQMISWDTETDVVVPGQWVKGVVAPWNYHLSPDGSKVVYFCQAHHDWDVQTYYAVSRPPYFTALALWRVGDAWAGDCFFRNNHLVFLSKGLVAPALKEGFQLPASFVVEVGISQSTAEHSALKSFYSNTAWPSLVALPPSISQSRWYLQCTIGPNRQHVVVEKSAVGVDRRFFLGDSKWDSDRWREIPDISWAGWDQRGRLVYCKAGCLFVAKVEEDFRIVDEKQVYDANGSTFTPVAPPDWAKSW